MNKKILAIIATGVGVSALALAAPGGGGAAIGPVNDSPSNMGAQRLSPQTNQFGTIPPNAQSSAGGQTGKMSVGVKANTSVKASSSKTKSTNRTPR